MPLFRPWPHDPRYLAGDDGSIVGPRGRALRTYRTPGGYLQFSVWPSGGQHQNFSVHVAVAEAWHGPRPEGMEVAHGNGDQADNRPTNLRWVTHAENEADKVAHGTKSLGERHGMSKLTEEAVRAIRAEYSKGRVRQNALANQYGVSKALISLVVRGRGWAHLDGAMAEPATLRGGSHPRARLTEDDVRAIRQAAAGGVRQGVLAKQYGVAYQTVNNVVRRINWAHIE